MHGEQQAVVEMQLLQIRRRGQQRAHSVVGNEIAVGSRDKLQAKTQFRGGNSLEGTRHKGTLMVAVELFAR